MKKFIIILYLSLITASCGKVGPLILPEDKLDKSIITYPCDKECLERFEAEKERQQSISITTD